MKLRIRYDETVQTIDLDEQATQQMWVSLSLDGGEGFSATEREKMIQEAFDREYNRPEYNCWHKFDRHRDANPKCRRMDGKKGYMQADEDDESFDIFDYLNPTENDDSGYEYEDTCSWIRRTLGNKVNWADAFIAVRIDGMSIREYAAKVGESENSITQKLKRAAKKLAENYVNRNE